MKILFFTPVPSDAAACRVRIEQYLPYLKERGHIAKVRPFMSSYFFNFVYKDGLYLSKTINVIRSTINRIIDIYELRDYDLVFIFREAYPFGPALFEQLVYIMKKPIIYDIDDAIYLPNTSAANKWFGFLKSSKKVDKIIHISKHVIVSNNYLADYVKRINKNVTIIPTSIDTNKFAFKKDKGSNDKIVIGWIGTNTTSRYLKILESVFRRLSLKYDFVLKIVGAGSKIDIKGVNIINQDWNYDREVSDFQSLDIGIYPLPDDEWARGKAGFKTLLYMAVGVPPVSSSVGINKEIINDGVNGFLASNDDEWVNKLSFLIENPEVREKMGIEGREIVESKYSLKVNSVNFVNLLESYI